jgi:hypothetical protein
MHDRGRTAQPSATVPRFAIETVHRCSVESSGGAPIGETEVSLRWNGRRRHARRHGRRRRAARSVRSRVGRRRAAEFGPVRVVSCAMGREKVHSEAPDAERVDDDREIEAARRGSLDIACWPMRFPGCKEHAIDAAQPALASVLCQARFRNRLNERSVNERQHTVIDRRLNGLAGLMTSSKCASPADGSPDPQSATSGNWSGAASRSATRVATGARVTSWLRSTTCDGNERRRKRTSPTPAGRDRDGDLRRVVARSRAFSSRTRCADPSRRASRSRCSATGSGSGSPAMARSRAARR